MGRVIHICPAGIKHGDFLPKMRYVSCGSDKQMVALSHPRLRCVGRCKDQILIALDRAGIVVEHEMQSDLIPTSKVDA
jgi:hypothetical protein